MPATVAVVASVSHQAARPNSQISSTWAASRPYISPRKRRRRDGEVRRIIRLSTLDASKCSSTQAATTTRVVPATSRWPLSSNSSINGLSSNTAWPVAR